MNNLTSLISSFVDEAKSAPKLFEDLSKVEEYIAETYLNRSFIELIQNADDAEATKFGIHKTSFGFVVCNNGRPFTAEDIEALCRSGASNKQRGGDTIGYRGIGFKSVVKLAKQIALWSGNYHIIFDKEKTKDLLHVSNAPVIRIPHETDKENLHSNEIMQLSKVHGYTTIFSFINPDSAILDRELKNFDSSCLLFLNHINKVKLETVGINRNIELTRKKISQSSNIINIHENTKLMACWNLHYSSKNIVAFKMRNNEIIAANGVESVIHSFMPSIEYTGAFIKINGDFSTDPSRKSINLDAESQNAIEKCAEILSNLFIEVISEKEIYKGFFKPFVNTNTETQTTTSRLFLNKTFEKLKAKTFTINGKTSKLDNFRLCPEWLNYNDYQAICTNDLVFVSKEFVSIYPECLQFFESVGIRFISIKDVENKINISVISENGATEICTKLINQYCYDMNATNIEKIKSLKIFPIKDKKGLSKITEIKSTADLQDNFFQTLSTTIESKQLATVFQKLDIEYHENLLEFTMPVHKEIKSPKNIASIQPIFNGVPKIEKWRSAEQNLVSYLQACIGVEKVFDVSTANIGYDIEVNFTNGKKAFIEVKSVSFFGDTFKLTNNEYSTAHNFQDNFYIALVINSTEFKVAFIQNPVSKLALNKQCERWSWVCNNASNEIIEVESFMKTNNNKI